MPNLNNYELQPHIVFSEWNENGRKIDSDIQNLYNHFNFKDYTKKIRVKMICNWCNSKQLCNEWKNMCINNYTWNNIEITWENTNIDYYVIINYPSNNEYYEPKRTIVFQMEPWVYNENSQWGVKTWGKWSEPSISEFLEVRGRKTNHHNNTQWQIELNPVQLTNLQYTEKSNILSSIVSSKYVDEGHIHRIDFLKFLEEKDDINLHIYGYTNKFQYKNYKKPLDINKKSNGILPYKYYFMVENNYEKNYITEKLWEPILCETLIFYYGCPNISDYINEKAYVQLDMNDFEKSYNIIKKAINEDWWSQRISIIKQEKNKILNELAFFPTLNNIIHKK